MSRGRTPKLASAQNRKPIRLRPGYGEIGYETNHAAASAPGGLSCAALILTRFEEGAVWEPQPVTSGQAALDTLPSALQSRDQGDQEPAAEPQGDPAGGLPVEALLEGDEQEQPEEDALEDVFGLGPAHGGIRCG